MVEAGRPVFVAGPGKLLPGEEAAGAAALGELRQAMKPILDRHGAVPAMNALISLWLDLHIGVLGVTETEASLRALRRDVPRFAAALRAAGGGDAGHG